MLRMSLVALTLACTAVPALAQYNPQAAVNEPEATHREKRRRADGSVYYESVRTKARGDQYGNAAGSQYDLAVDGAFSGKTIVVLHLYTGEGFDFHLPRAALKQKGFSVYRYSNGAPTPEVLAADLKKACQFWLISDSRRHLSAKHIAVIKRFFQSGRGVYIWGDNQPYYADANAVAQALLGVTMKGNLMGNKVVGISKRGRAGVLPKHLLTTGLAHLYEGITIATIQPNQTLTPLIYGSANNLVAAFYDKGGKRAILDGGFTRLYLRWDTAGTARYVKNAAAWLVNVERHGYKKLARQ
ncbi:MAG: hypothetical protein H6707_17220 [Deltaproteobacteria bacterium]|nr:hypothetical protein [Deltaproteobacteria bacterium]